VSAQISISGKARICRRLGEQRVLGWDGTAELLVGHGRPRISLTTSTSLDTFLLYSPSAEADFFCFEPVTHAVDAHHRGGLTRLEPGEGMSASMVLRVSW
jgi:aldose 1-epimerase